MLVGREAHLRALRPRLDDQGHGLDLPKDIAALAHLFPVLRRVPAIATRVPSDP
jgi:hypothetical protein